MHQTVSLPDQTIRFLLNEIPSAILYYGRNLFYGSMYFCEDQVPIIGAQ